MEKLEVKYQPGDPPEEPKPKLLPVDNFPRGRQRHCDKSTLLLVLGTFIALILISTYMAVIKLDEGKGGHGRGGNILVEIRQIFGGKQLKENESQIQKENEDVSEKDICSLKSDTGPCRAMFPRWYYDGESQMCKEFVYGGCDGNANNFESLTECQNTCMNGASNFYDEGEGKGNMEQFVEDSNRSTETDIMVKKNPCAQKPDVGSCNEKLERFFYNESSRKCEKFTYGGCEGNENNFKTVEDCISECKSIHEPKDLEKDVCEQEEDTGLCRAAIPRWMFDKERNKCRPFIYGGCGGNDNNFATKEKCELMCVKNVRSFKDKNELCTLKPDIGPCHGYMMRFYYDPEEEVCKKFYFGGCHGNANNFESEKECEKFCEHGKD